MKITCQSCQTKYTIADDKVAGKTVKIKCRKCGSPIVVHGDGGQASAGESAHATQAEGDDAAEPRGFAESAGGAPAPAGAGQWLVNVAEGDERSLTTAGIAAAYANGTITQDTYVWKEGMSDWSPVAAIPELTQAIAAQMQQAPHARPTPAPAVPEPAVGLGGTVMMDHAAPAPRAASAPPGAPRPASVPPPAAAATPTAARRAVNRGGVDVFGAREQAAASPAVSPSAPPPGDKLVGARNETSVLFSLSALTATESAAAKAQQDDAALLRPGPGAGGRPRPGPGAGPGPARNNGERAGFDDIMNLGGGGIGSPILAPPPVLAPVVEAPPPKPASMPPMAGMGGMGAGASAYPPMGMPDAPKKKSPVGIIIGVVAALAVVGGAAAAALGVFSSPPPVAQNDTPTTAQTGASEAKPADTAAAEAKPADTAGAEAKPADTAAAEAKPADTGPVAANTPGGPRPGGPIGAQPGGTKPGDKEPEKAPDKPAEPTPPPEKTAAPAEGGGSQEFNRGAATSALGSAAGAAKGCKKPDGPTGTGKVKVTFAPSGNVTSAQVQGAPFAGTPVGGCVASAFRSARVPPFSGAPVSVTKSFSIN